MYDPNSKHFSMKPLQECLHHSKTVFSMLIVAVQEDDCKVLNNWLHLWLAGKGHRHFVKLWGTRWWKYVVMADVHAMFKKSAVYMNVGNYRHSIEIQMHPNNYTHFGSFVIIWVLFDGWGSCTNCFDFSTMGIKRLFNRTAVLFKILPGCQWYDWKATICGHMMLPSLKLI